jgi:hypothetical protein
MRVLDTPGGKWNGSFLVLFFKKELLARGVGGAAARKRQAALLFEP